MAAPRLSGERHAAWKGRQRQRAPVVDFLASGRCCLTASRRKSTKVRIERGPPVASTTSRARAELLSCSCSGREGALVVRSPAARW